MSLSIYNKKRDFKVTPEPQGKAKRSQKKKGLIFVVQKHDASRLHYDFRLEWEGVLKSFAVPKGPSMNPKDKRLAVQTEDHPMDYASFEGIIPHGHYGAGEVIVWDKGTYLAEGSKNEKHCLELLEKGFKKGHLVIELFGEKLKGVFSLVRTSRESEKPQWLLIKQADEHASEMDILKEKQSALSQKKLQRDRTGQKSRGFKTVPMPKGLTPMLATLADRPFSKEGWLFEYKYDGYRTIAEIQKNKVHLFSRHRNPFDEKFKLIQNALKNIQHDCILDGEVVAFENGQMSFEALQNAEQKETQLKYFVFDLLFLDGFDLRKAPLLERKKLLRELIQDSEWVEYSPHRLKEGEAYFKEIAQEGGEGIMAKKADSPYLSGVRSRQWLKLKTHQRQEVVIGGFTEPRASRKLMGAIVVGVYNNDGELEYAGHVGGGFTEESLKNIYGELKKRIRKTSPFKKNPKTNTPVTWVKPELVAEVKFREWTSENSMRQPIFLGLREDKTPKEVKKEMPNKAEELVEQKGKTESKIRITHPEKILWPKVGLTKGDMIDYYEKISATILPYLKDRPQNLLRHPYGVMKESFYQKDVSTLKLPDFSNSIKIFSESNEGEIEYLICNNQETLLYMAQLGCIEIHPWNSRTVSLENPDYMIFDVDPSDDDFQEVIEVSLAIKSVLDKVGLKSYVKTSGKRGMHILIPVGAEYSYEVIREFAHLVMRLVHQKLPHLTTLERKPGKRGKKVYLDYLQNRAGQTLAAPYSLRATPEATVSTPLEWKEVNSKLNPKKFTIKTIQKRLKEKGDLWRDLLKEKVDLRVAIEGVRPPPAPPREGGQIK